ncbi:MAG: cobalt ECF transporter T component CbiQ [Muribaculaceae bacterium]|nr:cobalt ECF transporter T component CbiQ [Muribaculaceae bacterium]
MSIQRALITLNSLENGCRGIAVDSRFQITVTLLYLIAVLSVPLIDPDMMIWMFVYPIVMAEASGTGYGRVFVKSLWILPATAVIGMFNPIIDHSPAWHIGSATISAGWVTFISICLRGMLAVQGVLVLIYSTGFYAICAALQRMGLPDVLTTQLLMVYRYISVLLQESLSMSRARTARGFGRRNYPLRLWGVMVGQLLLRSVDRARRVHNAMLARGFSGILPVSGARKVHISDILYLIFWAAVFAILRFVDISGFLGQLINNAL